VHNGFRRAHGRERFGTRARFHARPERDRALVSRTSIARPCWRKKPTNKLHGLKASLDAHQLYAPAQLDEFASLYLSGAERDRLDPILDACAADYIMRLNKDAQVDFKGKAKAFLRVHGVLSSLLPYTNAEWEKVSIFLTFLVPKLPAPVEEDLSKGILEAIDMDSYRVEKRAVVKIQLPDANAEIEPMPTTGGGYTPEPELARLSNILKTFNDQFGNIPWGDADRVHKLITDDIPSRVAADQAYQNRSRATRTSRTRASITTTRSRGSDPRCSRTTRSCSSSSWTTRDSGAG